MINKLTGEPVSEEMQNVLKRLAVNEAVPESEIYALKEIKEANSCISSSKPTIELRNRTGIQLGVYNRLQNIANQPGIGYPLIIRPAFTLGGTGGGIRCFFFRRDTP